MYRVFENCGHGICVCQLHIEFLLIKGSTGHLKEVNKVIVLASVIGHRWLQQNSTGRNQGSDLVGLVYGNGI